MSDIKTNRLYFGDNLPFLRNPDYFPSESVDLIYLDPPFNSSQDYNVLYKEADGTPSTAQVKAFSDTWKWDESAEWALHEINQVSSSASRELVGLMNALEKFLGRTPMLAYLTQMTVRLVELRRILKPSGSLFLHCDPTASHYLKLVLDGIFTPRGFKNEIIWHYRRWPAKSSRLQRMHDIILFYSKSSQNNIFNTLFEPNSDGTIRRWKGKKSFVQYEAGRRHFSKMTVEDSLGAPMDDVWDIPVINSQAKERQGYPTQKPLELLRRIISISSNPGAIILDPFCGCGTTIDAVEALNQEFPTESPRQWIGIDITHLAIDLIKSRLAQRFGLGRGDYSVIGEPTTLGEAQALALEDRYQFQYWALGLVGARPWGDEKKKGKDRGVDGYRMFLHGPERSYQKCIIQVKSGKVGSSLIRDLKGTMEREGSELAAFITLEKETAEMRAEALAAGYYHSDVMNRDYQSIQILTIEELLKDSEIFKIPPGGDYSKIGRFQSPTKPQNGLF